ncbi:DNA-binding LacI/PurR family transcriptional regulator [Paenibacillus castaneae]|uniref:LacI family DNA-binding transcriptional regulator n=1 Tax=Paenibacillus castaneae TaxID=474957 RepID=UPI000C9A2E54|nr:LacI family DNA-binding transcriptional regulator [Paenibacillus castaneae]NIK78890.1 DNA-binding LacI/PurR family transcriptional regulator [Paenibacillus castaneae]
MKKITLQLIADKLGVSKALVSKALSNDPAVNDTTKDTIWKTAEEMGYPIKIPRKSIPTSLTGNLAVLMPRAYLDDMEYWGKVLHGIEIELANHSHSIILSSIDTNLSPREGLPSSIYEKKIDGAIVLGQLPEGFIEVLSASGFPYVMVEDHLLDPSIDHVLANHFLGAYQATTHLLDVGHVKLAFVGDVFASWSFRERSRGFQEAIRDYNRRGKGNAEAFTIDGIGMNESGLYQTTELAKGLSRQVKSDQPVTGLVCGNDLTALETLKLLQEWGVRCPSDISIIGFDDLSLTEVMNPKLTTVRVPKADLGIRAAQMILRRIENPSAVPEHVLLSTHLIKRASVADLLNRG